MNRISFIIVYHTSRYLSREKMERGREGVRDINKYRKIFEITYLYYNFYPYPAITYFCLIFMAYILILR